MKGQFKVGSSRKKSLVTILIGFILPVLAGGAVYFWQQSQLKSERQDAKEIQAALQEQITVLQGQVNAMHNEDKQKSEEPSSLDAAAIKTIAEASSWADLKDHADSSVEIILGASEGLGTRTPDQMVEDLKYLNSASGPWNFSLETSVIDSYKTGDYRQYFMAADQIIGRSSDGYVVAFALSDGKITDIFMIGDDELL